MHSIKILVLVSIIMLILVGCTSPKANREDYDNGKTENMSQDEDGLSTTNKILDEVKVNIDKAHEVGKNVDLLEADKYIDDAMYLLKQYLLDSDEDSINIDFIANISGIRVSENSDYILIEYDKHYYIYGGGTTGNYTSWKIIKYKPYNLVEVFVRNSPLLASHEHRMVIVDGHPTLFIYGYVTWDKGQTIFIKSYKIEEDGVSEVQATKIDSNNDALWAFYKDGRINTNKYMNKIFKFISEDAKKVEIEANDVDNTIHILKLNLNEDGQYEFLRDYQP